MRNTQNFALEAGREAQEVDGGALEVRLRCLRCWWGQTRRCWWGQTRRTVHAGNVPHTDMALFDPPFCRILLLCRQRGCNRQPPAEPWVLGRGQSAVSLYMHIQAVLHLVCLLGRPISLPPSFPLSSPSPSLTPCRLPEKAQQQRTMWQLLLSKCVSDPLLCTTKYSNPLFSLQGPEVRQIPRWSTVQSSV